MGKSEVTMATTLLFLTKGAIVVLNTAFRAKWSNMDAFGVVNIINGQNDGVTSLKSLGMCFILFWIKMSHWADMILAGLTRGSANDTFWGK